MQIKEEVEKIAQFAKSKKATDVKILNIESLSSVASYFVLATVTSTTQAKGVANYVEDEISKLGIEPIRKDVKHYAEWVVLDYGDILVHVMTDEARIFYNLDKLWDKGDNSINY
ncbi:MAG: ribosome silencing factor [Clostridia bacterium]|nr:ribosome silencing factor [Clostridia bacterium]